MSNRVKISRNRFSKDFELNDDSYWNPLRFDELKKKKFAPVRKRLNQISIIQEEIHWLLESLNNLRLSRKSKSALKPIMAKILSLAVKQVVVMNKLIVMNDLEYKKI